MKPTLTDRWHLRVNGEAVRVHVRDLSGRFGLPVWVASTHLPDEDDARMSESFLSDSEAVLNLSAQARRDRGVECSAMVGPAPRQVVRMAVAGPVSVDADGREAS